MNPELQQTIVDLIKPHVPLLTVAVGLGLTFLVAYLKQRLKLKAANIEVQDNKTAVNLMAAAIEVGSALLKQKLDHLDLDQPATVLAPALKDIPKVIKNGVECRTDNTSEAVWKIVTEAARKADPKKKGG